MISPVTSQVGCSVWTRLDPFGPVWTYLDPFGPVWIVYLMLETFSSFLHQTDRFSPNRAACGSRTTAFRTRDRTSFSRTAPVDSWVQFNGFKQQIWDSNQDNFIYIQTESRRLRTPLFRTWMFRHLQNLPGCSLGSAGPEWVRAELTS